MSLLQTRETRARGRLSRLLISQRSVNSSRGEQSSAVIPSPGGKGDPAATSGKAPGAGLSILRETLQLEAECLHPERFHHRSRGKNI